MVRRGAKNPPSLESQAAERIRALEERVAYLEGLVRELLSRPQPPVYVLPQPQPSAPQPQRSEPQPVRPWPVRPYEFFSKVPAVDGSPCRVVDAD
jgi:hypothetical protein